MPYLREAPKGRKIHSLGRQPQGQVEENFDKPRSGDRRSVVNCCGSRRSANLSPLQGSLNVWFRYLGLTPQAMDLSPLRGFP